MGRIPRGATDIDIRQHGYNNLTKDDNYLGEFTRYAEISID